MVLSDYFERVSVEGGVFHFKLKGFWDDKFAKELATEFWNEFVKSVDVFQKGKFIVLADM